MTIAAILLLLNPAVVASILAGYGDERDETVDARTLGITAVAALAILTGAVLVGGALLDALSMSDATFRIAAGVIAIFSAFQAFLRLGIDYRRESRHWLVVAVVIWLTSPGTLAVAVAVRLNDGLAVGIAVTAAAVLVTVGLGSFWMRTFECRYALLLGWIRRGMAAGAAIGGVDLIRQGIFSI